MIRSFLKLILKFCFALFLFAMAAEAISHLFLPAPVTFKLPMVKFVADPACGYRLQPNQKAYTLSSPVTVNQWGFRGKNWTIQKPANTVRIAMLGSSYAFGHGVNDEDMFATQVEKILNENASPGGPHYEVMSFGMGGYDSGHEIKVLEAYALKFQPDIVILNFFFNDQFYIKDYGFYPKMFALQEKAFSLWRWKLRNFCRNSRLAMFLWDYYHDKINIREPGEVGQAVKAYVFDGVMPPAGPNGEGWKFIASQIQRLHQLSVEHHFQTFMTIIPTHQEMLEKNIKNAYVDFLTTASRSSLGSDPIVMLDVFRKERADLSTLLIPYDYHLSNEGHRIMARVIAERLDPSIAARSRKP